MTQSISPKIQSDWSKMYVLLLNNVSLVAYLHTHYARNNYISRQKTLIHMVLVK